MLTLLSFIMEKSVFIFKKNLLVLVTTSAGGLCTL